MECVEFICRPIYSMDEKCEDRGMIEFAPADVQKREETDRMRRMKAGLKGFEPLAYGLRVRRSTELSYKPVLVLQYIACFAR